MNFVTVPVEGFSESSYFEHNPDVAEAVKNGGFITGWEHYVFFGINEGRAGVPEKVSLRLKAIIAEKFPKSYPPHELQLRTQGYNDISGYYRVGNLVAHNMKTTLDKYRVIIPKGGKILDFGCGSGRIISWFRHYFKSCHFKGVDIDAEAVQWCQNNLSDIAGFSTNNHLPPLPFEDNCFDFVYSISIFTHLPEDMQLSWLKELRRITKKNGWLILTTHGKHLVNIHDSKKLITKTPELEKSFSDRGFVYYASYKQHGLPEFYQYAYHREDYIRKYWSQFFEITAFAEKGIANFQDLILCRVF